MTQSDKVFVIILLPLFVIATIICALAPRTELDVKHFATIDELQQSNDPLITGLVDGQIVFEVIGYQANVNSDRNVVFAYTNPETGESYVAIPLEDGSLHYIAHSNSVTFSRPQWSPDGNRIVFNQVDGDELTLVFYTFGEFFPHRVGLNGPFDRSSVTWINNEAVTIIFNTTDGINGDRLYVSANDDNLIGR